MTDAEVLNLIIKDSARVECSGQISNKRAILTEKKVKDSSATIINIPHDAVVINVDEFVDPGCIFSTDKGICCRCDYAIISEKKRVIILVEMKKTKNSWKHIVMQLKGGKCFIHYCQEIGKQFAEKHDFLDNYHFRFVSIAHTAPRKTATEIIRHEPNDKPHKALKILYPKRIEFLSLL